MNDAFGNPIVLGQRYKCSDLSNREWTSTHEGTAIKVLNGVNGQKITLCDIVAEDFKFGVSHGKFVYDGVTSVYPCHLFPIPQDAK